MEFMYIIADNQNIAFEAVSAWTINQELTKLNYSNVSINIVIKRLIEKGLLEIKEAEIDYNDELYFAYKFTIQGEKWVMNNIEQYEKKRLEKNIENKPFPYPPFPNSNDVTLDDDLPF